MLFGRKREVLNWKIYDDETTNHAQELAFVRFYLLAMKHERYQGEDTSQNVSSADNAGDLKLKRKRVHQNLFRELPLKTD